jgi:cysteine desulfurase
VKLTAQMHGGGHEKGMRSGTLNVPGIAGFGKACEICKQEMDEESVRIQKLRDKLESSLLKIEEAHINGSHEKRLPHVTNICFNYVEGEALLMAINKEIAVSSGSACTSESMEPSYVLKALGLSDEQAYSSLRFALGRNTTEEEIDFVISKISAAVPDLRNLSPRWEEFENDKNRLEKKFY